MARIWGEPAWVLHSRDYGESSQIVELLTYHHGRVNALARGVKRIRRAGRLDVLTRWIVAWSGREGQLATLTSADRQGIPLRLEGVALWAGFHINDLILRMTGQYDPIMGVYDRYSEAVTALESEPPARVVCLFERDLLVRLGYGLNLTEDVDLHQPIDPDARYFFDPLSGARRADTMEGWSVKGASLLDLAQGRLDDRRSLEEARRLLALVYDAHLGPDTLRVRRWVETLMQFSGQMGRRS
ncbi:DNA repair protein RecO [mine drainage metagenome]|uniref:DNA repair protein RecO n=1 Tax=mine drainage metagenome TaxID=410659 RepID=T1BUZ4_9ZZZZ